MLNAPGHLHEEIYSGRKNDSSNIEVRIVKMGCPATITRQLKASRVREPVMVVDNNNCTGRNRFTTFS